MAQVYFADLKERGMIDTAHGSLMSVALKAGARGYAYINMPTLRVEHARNAITSAFCMTTQADDDLLVMLDADHQHPENILSHLAGNPVECGVVAALAFRRGAPHDPCAYAFDEKGGIQSMAKYPRGLLEVDATGSAAIAIRRWVFKRLRDEGVPIPYWRQWYYDGIDVCNGEDIYFTANCTKHGIKCYVDTTIETPHITQAFITEADWLEWKRKTQVAIESFPTTDWGLVGLK